MKFSYAFAALLLFTSLRGDDTSSPVFHQCCLNQYRGCNLTFEVFGEWLYLQPNGSNLYYAAEAFPYDTSLATPAVSPNWKIFEIDPSYHSAFKVGINFILPKNDLNIEFNWERLRGHDTDSMKVTPLSYGTGNMVGPIYDIGPNSAEYKTAKGKATFLFDEANLFVGKTFCCMKDLNLRLYLGASFASIEQKISSYYANSSAATSRKIDANSKYWGIGPQVGLNLNYRMINDFYLTGNSVISLYMGRLKNHTTFRSNSPSLATVGVAEPNIQQTVVPHRSQLVPGFEERLGLAYMHAFKKWELKLGIGYLVQIYLNAVQSMDMLTQVLPGALAGSGPTVGVFALTFNRTLSNFILTGPYASLGIDF